MNLFWPFRRKQADAPDHIRAGLWGEKQAARLLRRKGYRILGQRIRVGRRDELDIVARNGDTLVFVEVKTRADEQFARAASAIDSAKRHAMSRAAARYVNKLREKPSYLRFDVVEVIGREGGGEPEIRHFENAFSTSRRYRIR